MSEVPHDVCNIKLDFDGGSEVVGLHMGIRSVSSILTCYKICTLISRIKIRFVAQTGYERESFGEYPARVLN